VNKHYYIPSHVKLYRKLPDHNGGLYRYEQRPKPSIGFVIGEEISLGILFKRILMKDGVYWVHHKHVMEPITKEEKNDKASRDRCG